jgi:hypothetical protein
MLGITVSLILILHTIAAIVLIITAGNKNQAGSFLSLLRIQIAFFSLFLCQSFWSLHLGPWFGAPHASDL